MEIEKKVFKESKPIYGVDTIPREFSVSYEYNGVEPRKESQTTDIKFQEFFELKYR